MKILQVKRYLMRWAARDDKKHPLLPRPCEVSISMLAAGQHPSSFAEDFVITTDTQYLPSEVDESGLGGNVRKEIEEHLLAIAATDPWLRSNPPIFEWFVDADCAEVHKDHELVTILSDSIARTGRAPRIGGTEAHTTCRCSQSCGSPTVNFGPGSPAIAHQTNEHCQYLTSLMQPRHWRFSIVQWCGLASP